MSKATEAAEEQVPSYEESIANSPSSQQTPPVKTTKHNSLHQRTQQERQRRISTLIVAHIEPSITTTLNDGIPHLVLILVPSDVCAHSTPLTDKSITSPNHSHPTTVIHLTSPDYSSSFVYQYPFVSDLADQLIHNLPSPSTSPSVDTPPIAQATLPSRPPSQSWLRRTFTLPPATHDPTGTTGAWKLGWRSEEDPSATTKTVVTDNVTIKVKLENITFRTESEMGLWESKGVRCVWVELEFS